MSVSQSEATATSLIENFYSRMFNQNQDMSMKDDIIHADMVNILHDQTLDQVPIADTGDEIEFANTTSSLRDQTFNSFQHTGTENAVVSKSLLDDTSKNMLVQCQETGLQDNGTTDDNLQLGHQVTSSQAATFAYY
jgi:hypothetical protein